MVVRLNGPVVDPAWQVDDLSLEDIVLAYLGQHAAAGHDAPERIRAVR
jgi:hypothetical protein